MVWLQHHFRHIIKKLWMEDCHDSVLQFFYKNKTESSGQYWLTNILKGGLYILRNIFTLGQIFQKKSEAIIEIASGNWFFYKILTYEFWLF